MVILVAVAILAVLLVIVGLVVVLIVQGRARREAARKAALPVKARRAALRDRIEVERLLIEIDRAAERYRAGESIEAGAPKEWVP